MFSRRAKRTHSEAPCTVCLEREARQARTDSVVIIPAHIREMSDRDLLFFFGEDSTPQELAQEIECELILRDFYARNEVN